MSEAEYNPNPSPAWVKDTVAEPMAKNARMTGPLPDSRAIDADVQRMIERYDAEEREHGSDVHKNTRPPMQLRDVAADEAAKIGATFVRDDSLAARIPAAQPVAMTPWQEALARRMREVIALQPGAKLAWKNQLFRHPRLAQEYLTELMNWKSRRGRYLGMTESDANRAMSRYSEDLADRSVPVLGRWRVGGV
jgi:hypothetical protein